MVKSAEHAAYVHKTTPVIVCLINLALYLYLNWPLFATAVMCNGQRFTAGGTLGPYPRGHLIINKRID